MKPILLTLKFGRRDLTNRVKATFTPVPQCLRYTTGPCRSRSWWLLRFSGQNHTLEVACERMGYIFEKTHAINELEGQSEFLRCSLPTPYSGRHLRLVI